MYATTPELLRSSIRTLPTGTTIFCHSPNHLSSRIISAGLGSPYSHTATIWWKNGEPRIVEALWQRKVCDYDFYEWVENRFDNSFAVSIPDCIISDEDITNHFGKRYDGISVLLWMPVYRGTGVWLGRVNNKASERVFCFELTALIRKLGGKWWKMVPQNFPEWEEVEIFDPLINLKVTLIRRRYPELKLL